MYQDINNIIHKYHHNLKMSDVLRELQMKHIIYNHKCHYCNDIRMTIKRKPCVICSIYVCNKCEKYFNFNISRMMCGFCLDEQYASFCCLIFIQIIAMSMYLMWIFA